MEEKFLQNKGVFPKIMIGTVQFGMPYGIANQKGQPSRNEVYEIIKHAHESGIDQYDTASVYGESETRLGLAFKELNVSKNVSIFTKIAPLDEETRKSGRESKKTIILSLEDSLKKLKMDCVSGVLFHREEDAVHLEVLQHQKELGKCESIGVSCGHNPTKVKKWMDSKNLDTLQIPANLMDQRHFKNETYAFDRHVKTTIFLRSIFLQGILTMRNNQIPKILKSLKPLHLRFSNLAEKAGLPLKELSLRAMISSGASHLILGNDSLNHLKENISIFNRGPLTNELMQALKQSFEELDPRWITPSLWPSTA